MEKTSLKQATLQSQKATID